jgi:hypothetical protein
MTVHLDNMDRVPFHMSTKQNRKFLQADTENEHNEKEQNKLTGLYTKVRPHVRSVYMTCFHIAYSLCHILGALSYITNVTSKPIEIISSRYSN